MHDRARAPETGRARAIVVRCRTPDPSGVVHDRLIRGRALIFRIPRPPGNEVRRKLDAIDTDQITPAADCVSESLETLDENGRPGRFAT